MNRLMEIEDQLTKFKIPEQRSSGRSPVEQQRLFWPRMKGEPRREESKPLRSLNRNDNLSFGQINHSETNVYKRRDRSNNTIAPRREDSEYARHSLATPAHSKI